MWFLFILEIWVCACMHMQTILFKIIIVLLKGCCYPMSIGRKGMNRNIGRVVNQCDCCSILYDKICLCV